MAEYGTKQHALYELCAMLEALTEDQLDHLLAVLAAVASGKEVDHEEVAASRKAKPRK